MATCPPGSRCTHPPGISIHATHAGGDAHSLTVSGGGGRFQSTPPMRVATAGCQSRIKELKDFNPRHPCGWRQRTVRQFLGKMQFQSTPPMRVATRRGCDGKGIHSHFNPRHPCGWRHGVHKYVDTPDFISIHATHAGGDLQGISSRPESL